MLQRFMSGRTVLQSFLLTIIMENNSNLCLIAIISLKNFILMFENLS